VKRYFFDTSALVKVYHREEGSDFCLKIYSSQSPIIISELARVELLSALYRKHREKQLNAKALQAVLKIFKLDYNDRYEVLQLASLIYDDACTQHSSVHGLRTLDSLQLATFLNYCEQDQDSFVCADKKLFDVVKSEGVDAIFF
jgi:predicted nucleic acid-binding protein